jgi:hypothetical protein
MHSCPEYFDNKRPLVPGRDFAARRGVSLRPSQIVLSISKPFTAHPSTAASGGSTSERAFPLPGRCSWCRCAGYVVCSLVSRNQCASDVGARATRADADGSSGGTCTEKESGDKLAAAASHGSDDVYLRTGKRDGVPRAKSDVDCDELLDVE